MLSFVFVHDSFIFRGSLRGRLDGFRFKCSNCWEVWELQSNLRCTHNLGALLKSETNVCAGSDVPSGKRGAGDCQDPPRWNDRSARPAPCGRHYQGGEWQRGGQWPQSAARDAEGGKRQRGAEDTAQLPGATHSQTGQWEQARVCITFLQLQEVLQPVVCSIRTQPLCPAWLLWLILCSLSPCVRTCEFKFSCRAPADRFRYVAHACSNVVSLIHPQIDYYFLLSHNDHQNNYKDESWLAMLSSPSILIRVSC